MSVAATLSFEARDISGQHHLSVDDVPADATIGEIIQGLKGDMELKDRDSSGRPISWVAHLEREGRLLLDHEIAGEVLRAQGDRLDLQSSINAGAP